MSSPYSSIVPLLLPVALSCVALMLTLAGPVHAKLLVCCADASLEGVVRK